MKIGTGAWTKLFKNLRKGIWQQEKFQTEQRSSPKYRVTAHSTES